MLNIYIKYISFYLFFPEFYLSFFTLVLFIFFFCYSTFYLVKKFLIFLNLVVFLYLQVIFYTFLLLLNNINYKYSLFIFSYISNNFIVFTRLFFLILFFIFLCLSLNYLINKKILILEYIYLLTMSFCICFIIMGVNDFLLLYILLELQNICIYFLISLKRTSETSVEAAIKYFLISSVMMSVFLYGISICYFDSGLMNFYDFELFLWNPSFNFFTTIGLSLILISFIIKIGLPPFYFWIIEVYNGCSVYFLFYLLIFIKFFYFSLLLKLYFIFHDLFYFFNDFLINIIIITIFTSIIFGLYQIKFKKFFIYSSISNSSFFLFLFISNNLDNYLYFFYFSLIYLFNMLGIYIGLVNLNNWSTNLIFKKITSITNFFNINLYFSIIFSSFLLSLAGLPLFSGFLYKFYFLNLLFNSNFFF